MPLYLCVQYMPAAYAVRKTKLGPLELKLWMDVCGLPCICWKPHLGDLEGLPVLLTAESHLSSPTPHEKFTTHGSI